MKLILLALAALLVGPVLATAQTTENVDIVVTHGTSCAGGPTISTDNYAPTAGSTVHVTVACGPGNPKDYVQFALAADFQAYGPYIYLNGATGGTFAFTIPNVSQDRPAQYKAFFACCDSTRKILAVDQPVVVPPTVNPPAPTQGLPASEAANPFVPAHTITVCRSGCNYTALGDATDAAFSAGWDNVLIKISAGDYQYPARNLSGRYPPHLWIKGISSDGVTFPHIYGVTNTSGSIFGTTQYYTPGQASLTLDNLELGPWTYRILAAQDATQWTLRNVYVHDGTQGLISGNVAHLTFNFYNSVFARLGTGDGPEHDVYIGEGDHTSIVTVNNSVFEQSHIGHSFKERAQTLKVNCSIFAVNQDQVYLGSETIDLSEGGNATITNSLSAAGGANPQWSSSNAWDSMRYGYEAGAPPNLPFASNRPVINNTVFLADDPAHYDMFTMGLPVTPTPPITWSNNKFVWLSAPGAGGPVWFSTDRYGHAGDIVLDGTNQSFNSRAAAGFPAVGG
jgi:hypothetical protein